MNQANSSDNDYWIKKPQEYISVHKQITVETQSNSFACVDFYKQARDQFLSLRFEDYPDIVISSFSLSCMIPNNTKKAPLVYAILEKIQYTTVDNNAVSIKIITEKDILLLRPLNLNTDIA